MIKNVILGPFFSSEDTCVKSIFYYTYGRHYAGGRGAVEWYDNKDLIVTPRMSLWGDSDDPWSSLGLNIEGCIKALTPLSNR
eukprot:UN05435